MSDDDEREKVKAEGRAELAIAGADLMLQAPVVSSLNSAVKAAVGRDLLDVWRDWVTADRDQWGFRLMRDAAQAADDLDQQLAEEPAAVRPRSGHVHSVVEAAIEARQRQADPRMDEVLRQAAMGAFDPEVYRQGVALHLIRILGELTYGEIVVLRWLDEVDQSRERRTSHTDLAAHCRELAAHHQGVLDRHGLARSSRTRVLPLGRVLLRMLKAGELATQSETAEE